MGFHSGPAMGVVAGNNIPNYCIMSDTGNLARLVHFYNAVGRWFLICRVMEKMGEGMRIHISSISKELLDMVAFKQIHQNTFYMLQNISSFDLTRLGASDATIGGP